jgi:hypothetical protein
MLDEARSVPVAVKTCYWSPCKRRHSELEVSPPRSSSALQMTRCYHARTLHVQALFHVAWRVKGGSVNPFRMMPRRK